MSGNGQVVYWNLRGLWRLLHRMMRRNRVVGMHREDCTGGWVVDVMCICRNKLGWMLMDKGI